jgi:hypothetical protein
VPNPRRCHPALGRRCSPARSCRTSWRGCQRSCSRPAPPAPAPEPGSRSLGPGPSRAQGGFPAEVTLPGVRGTDARLDSRPLAPSFPHRKLEGRPPLAVLVLHRSHQRSVQPPLEEDRSPALLPLQGCQLSRIVEANPVFRYGTAVLPVSPPCLTFTLLSGTFRICSNRNPGARGPWMTSSWKPGSIRSQA